VAQTLPRTSATPSYRCPLGAHTAGHPVDSVFVNARRARQRGDDRGADIKGDVCATRVYWDTDFNTELKEAVRRGLESELSGNETVSEVLKLARGTIHDALEG